MVKANQAGKSLLHSVGRLKTRRYETLRCSDALAGVDGLEMEMEDGETRRWRWSIWHRWIAQPTQSRARPPD
jgi:hypothetical protein